MSYYIKDNNGHRWKVREAKSIEAACNEIANARITGSVGSRSVADDTLCGGSRYVIADVVRVHGDDFSEQKPYEALRFTRQRKNDEILPETIDNAMQAYEWADANGYVFERLWIGYSIYSIYINATNGNVFEIGDSDCRLHRGGKNRKSDRLLCKRTYNFH